MSTVLLLVAKDLRVEWRSRRRLLSLVFFGVALAVVVSQSYRGRPDLTEALPTLIWELTIFLQLLFLGQAYQVEAENGCFEGLRLSPVRRSQIALAKTAAGSLLVGVPDLLVLGLLAFLTGSPAPLTPGLLALLAVETVGLVALGNLLFSCTAAGEAPAVDLYAFVLLLGAPLLFFGPDATRRLFEGEAPGRLLLYYAFLGAYAAGLVGICAAAYGSFLEEPAPRHPR